MYKVKKLIHETNMSITSVMHLLTIKSLYISSWIERAMATKLVCLLISSYLLLAGDYHVVSGFIPVTYSSESSSTECGQSHSADHVSVANYDDTSLMHYNFKLSHVN